MVSKDPETGIPDIGHYRSEIIDKQTMSFNVLPNHRFGKHIARNGGYFQGLLTGAPPTETHILNCANAADRRRAE